MSSTLYFSRPWEFQSAMGHPFRETLDRYAKGNPANDSWINCPGERGVTERLTFGETAVEIRRWAAHSGSLVIAVAVYPDAQSANTVFACDAGDMRKHLSALTGPGFIRWREVHVSYASLPPSAIETPASGEARLVGNVIVGVEVESGDATENWARPDAPAPAIADRMAQRARRG